MASLDGLRSLMDDTDGEQQIKCGAPTAMPGNVRIVRVSNGFIIYVGCKTFVSKDWVEVCAGLDDYWKDPKAAEEKWCK